MVAIWRIFGDFCVLYFSASRMQHVSDLPPKFFKATSCVEVRLPLGEKKKERDEEETTGQKYNVGMRYAERP